MSAPMTGQLQEDPIRHLETPPVHIKEILAATDFSNQATLALKFAAQLAKQLHCRLHVLYTVTPQLYISDIKKIEIEHGREQLHEYASKIPEVRTIEHEEIVLCGSAIDQISAVADTKGIDLVVMGSHGRSGLGKMALGSVAEAAIRQVPCPVLVVGPHCPGRCAPLESIVLATDLAAGSLRAAQYTMSIARYTHARLTVVHVLPEKATVMPAGDTVEHTAMELRRLIPHDPQVESYVRFEIVAGNPAEEILRIAKRNKAGMIVMGAREHRGLANHAPWATLSEVIRESHCPVLVVQPGRA